MKVVFFNSCKKWGGGEKWHSEMALGLKEKGHQVLAFATKNSPLYEQLTRSAIETIPITISNISLLNPLKYIKLSLQLKKLNPDAILLNMSIDIKIAGVAAKHAGIKNIIYRRGSAIPIRNTCLNRLLFKKNITHIIANSQETAKTILQHNTNLFPKSKIKIIYNGIDTQAYLNQDSKPIYAKQQNEIVLGNLARLSHQKGQEYLVNLAYKLKSEKISFKLLIGGSGESESKLKKLVHQKNLDDCIIFMGFIENPKDFLSSIDIFIFPSIWEGFGYSIIEAKLLKKPVVAFNTSSNPEVICDSIDGFLVDAFNEDLLFSKTLELINNSTLRVNMGEAGYADVVKRFKKSKALTELSSFLECL